MGGIKCIWIIEYAEIAIDPFYLDERIAATPFDGRVLHIINADAVSDKARRI